MSVPSPRTDPERIGRARRSGDLYAHPRKAQAVRAWLADQPRDDGDIVASQRDIADGTGIPVATVRRALRLLIDTDQIAVTEVGTGSYYASRYRLGTESRAGDRVATPPASSTPVA